MIKKYFKKSHRLEHNGKLHICDYCHNFKLINKKINFKSSSVPKKIITNFKKNKNYSNVSKNS